MKKAILLISILSLLFVIFASCQSEPAVPYIYQSPENIDDGFNTGTIDEVGIYAELIEIKSLEKELKSVLVDYHC